MAWDLCSKEDVMAFHPITETELKDEWSTMVEALIREHKGQPYLGMAEAIVDEYYNGDGTPLLIVRHPPIISVSALAINESALSESDYIVFDHHIALKSMTFSQGWMNVKTSYLSGTTNVPPDVRLAAITMITAVAQYRKRAGADASIKWGNTEQYAGEKSPNMDIGLPTHLQQIMKQVLKRSHVRVR